MPQKRKQRPPPIEDPPTASSSESEEDDEEAPPSQPHATPAAVQVSSSGEEEDSSQEEDDEQPSTLRTSANPPSNPQPKFSSESESDTDSEPTWATPKPTEQAQTQTQTQRSPAPAKSGSKRPAHFTEPKGAKKKTIDAPSSSVANDETGEDGKKSGGRIWSLEDELCILKGMNEFFSKTGQDAYRNADAFHNFIKKSLHVEVTSNQLKEKIRRLKKKFENHLDREQKGLEPRFSKHHDEAVLEFSKKVWGGGANGLVEKPKPNGKAAAKSPQKKVAVSTAAKLKGKVPEKSSAPPLALPEPGNNVSLLYREMSRFQELDEDDMKRGLTLIGESKRKELEGKWKILRLAEMEVLANRSLLMGELIKLVSEALQSSNN